MKKGKQEKKKKRNSGSQAEARGSHPRPQLAGSLEFGFHWDRVLVRVEIRVGLRVDDRVGIRVRFVRHWVEIRVEDEGKLRDRLRFGLRVQKPNKRFCSPAEVNCFFFSILLKLKKVIRNLLKQYIHLSLFAKNSQVQCDTQPAVHLN